MKSIFCAYVEKHVDILCNDFFNDPKLKVRLRRVMFCTLKVQNTLNFLLDLDCRWDRITSVPRGRHKRLETLRRRPGDPADLLTDLGR